MFVIVDGITFPLDFAGFPYFSFFFAQSFAINALLSSDRFSFCLHRSIRK